MNRLTQASPEVTLTNFYEKIWEKGRKGCAFTPAIAPALKDSKHFLVDHASPMALALDTASRERERVAQDLK